LSQSTIILLGSSPKRNSPIRVRSRRKSSIKTFHRLAGLKLSNEDGAKAVAENTAYMGMYGRDNTNSPLDVSWTYFKLGWDHRSLVIVDHLELRDSETGELVMEYPQPGGEGRAARFYATAAIN
jgi:hypothetical protein